MKNFNTNLSATLSFLHFDAMVREFLSLPVVYIAYITTQD